VALLIIVLLTGAQLHVNPNAIAALVTARDADDTMKRYTDEVRCVVQMVNRKEYTTKEECSSIELRINEMKP
jgi:hypothetical protein